MAIKHPAPLRRAVPARLAIVFAASAVPVLAGPVPAWAIGGLGCSNLPEYARAQGALQGMTSACDMSVEEARRIIAAQDGPASAAPVAPRHRRHYRHYRRVD